MNIFGIDLGTSNIKIYNKKNDIIFNEKNIAAVENKDRIFAIGDEAFEMYEKAPANIQVSYPVNGGVIANIKHMQTILKMYLETCGKRKENIYGANYYIAVPTDITNVEKRAFLDLIEDSGIRPKKVWMVEKPLADAVGSGLDIHNAHGIMIVDIGADTTEISVLSLGGTVLSRIINMGGNRFDEAIRHLVKDKYNLLIGSRTAENAKKELADATGFDERTTQVYGRDIVSGLPVNADISSEMVYQALRDHLNAIVDAVKVILERTPPELSSDIIGSGIYMTGGSALIKNLDILIGRETDLKVNRVDQPQESVVRGLKTIITQADYQDLAYSLKDKTIQ